MMSRDPKRGDTLAAPGGRRVRVVKVNRVTGACRFENLDTGKTTDAMIETVRRRFSLDKHNTNRGRSVNRDPASDQGRPPKAFDDMVTLLSGPGYFSAIELSQEMQISVRTVYRYLGKLDAAGKLETFKPENPHEPFTYSIFPKPKTTPEATA